MAKKLGKLLLGVAAIAGTAAAAYYYLQKKDAVIVTPESNDEDLDDFSDELDETPSRNYVQLNKDVAAKEEVNANVSEEEETADEAAAKTPAAEEVVEEFFDEEDPVTE